MKPCKILVATGSSGGHIFPALAFIEALKDNTGNVDLVLLLPEKAKGKFKQLDNPDFKTCYVPLSALKVKASLESFKNLCALVRTGLITLKVLLKFQPDVVVGFGSAASIPAVIFGWLLRAKTLIHEQNVIPGEANRLLAEFSDKIAVSFSETKQYLKSRHNHKTVITGNPLRKDIQRVDKTKALEYFHLSNGRLTILVTGGSQGSSRLNREFLNAVSLIKDKSGLQVIHLAGGEDYQMLKSGYEACGIGFSLFEFLEPVQYAYSASDIVLSRSGAATVSELIYFNLPAMLIPYPYAHKHQLKNAKVLEEKGCAVIIEDNDLTAQLLREKIESMARPDKLRAMRDSYAGFKFSNAAQLLAEQVLSLCEN